MCALSMPRWSRSCLACSAPSSMLSVGLVERAAVVSGPVVADELVVVQQRRVEAHRRDQAVGDVGAVDAQHRLAGAEHGVLQRGVADLRRPVVRRPSSPGRGRACWCSCLGTSRSSTTSSRYGPSWSSMARSAGSTSPGLLDLHRGHAERAGQRDEVDAAARARRRTAGTRRPAASPAPPLVVAPVLHQVLLEQPVAGVVADHELRADPVVRRGPQRLVRVHRAAVAGEARRRSGRDGRASRRPHRGCPTPSVPPGVWKKCPGRLGVTHRVSSGELVSASSKTMASGGSSSASRAATADIRSGVSSRRVLVGLRAPARGPARCRRRAAAPAAPPRCAGRRS